MRSTTSAFSGHSRTCTGYQKSALVRGQVPDVRNTRPTPSGTRRRYGSEESGSGLRAMSSSATPRILAYPGTGLGRLADEGVAVDGRQRGPMLRQVGNYPVLGYGDITRRVR